VVDWWIAAAGVTSLVAAAVYAYIGLRLARRSVAVEARLASTQFTIWWWGLAASVTIAGLLALVAAAGPVSLPIALTAYILMLLIDVALLWGIVGFLIYVYTGQYYLVPLTGFYGAFYVALLYFVFVQDPTGLVLQGGSVQLVYSAVAPAALTAFVVLAIILPEFAAAIAYLSLLRRTRDPTQRYRIALVGISVLAWFFSALFIPSTTPAWGLAKSAFQIAAALVTLLAYLPPAWVQTRYGIGSIAPTAPGPGGVTPSP